MIHTEILSPAGNMEMLKYAVLYGADAVYLAGKEYGARKFANNFDREELAKAVEYAHLYGVKVYLTINTLIKEIEIKDFLDYVSYIYEIGIDAVLIQDFGMLKLVHKNFKNLEIHASTQMHNNSSNMLNLLKTLGVKRVVLDREMSIDEIKSLPKDIEIEVFAHGALCVSYSGQCLFSSQVLNRSGNRGECAGMCRLPYEILENGKRLPKAYYLSLKDLCSAQYIDKLLDLGISSLKIEGRMKSPEYVGYITKVYKRLVDSYERGNYSKITDAEYKNIQLLFNRGLTEGFLNNETSENIVNRINPNHIGIHLGTYRVKGKKIELKLDDDLTQGDTIRFKEADKGMTVNFLYDKSDNLKNKICKSNICYVDNFLDITGFGELRKVGSIELNEEISNLPKRTVKIDGSISVKKSQRIFLEITCNDSNIKVEGSIPESAKTRAITKEDIQKQITKTGSYVYEFNSLNIDLDDNLFINLKELNELRRNALDKLNELRTKRREHIKVDYNPTSIKHNKGDIVLNIILDNEEQYEIVKKYTENIYTRNEKLLKKHSLYHHYEERQSNIDSSKYIIGDYGTLILTNKNDEVHTDYMLNVTNSNTVNHLKELNAKVICLSIELSDDDIEEITKNTDPSNLEILVYGHIELMKMKFDPSPNNDVKLIDRNNSTYNIHKTSKFNYLMSSSPINILDNIEYYIELGIRNFRIDFTEEKGSEIEKILEKFVEKSHIKIN